MAPDEPHYTSLTQDGLPLSPLRYKDTRSPSSVVNFGMRESGERRKHGIGVWSPLWMLGGTLAAAVFAHHLFDAHLDTRSVARFWTQANSGRVEIFFASVFKILFCFSAGVSVCQLSWFSSFGGSYGVPTQTWDKTALVGILSETPVGWPMPQGCSPECTYASSIEYIVPAIRCSDLKPDQIDDGVEPMYRTVFQDPPSAYLLGYDALSVGSGYQSSPLNFTVQNATTNVSDRYTWTMAYLPFLSSTVPAGSLINAAGSVCTFYNATHAASTHYFNGTQETPVSVVEFHNPLNTTYRQGSPSVNLSAPGTGSHFHLLAIADSISTHLEGSVVIDGHFSTVVATTLMTQSNIFEPYNADSMAEIGGQIFGLNTTASVTNVSQALQDLVANITLVGSLFPFSSRDWMTTVDATVISTDIVYIYDRETLLATYSAAFFLLILMSAVGMFSLMKDGESNSNTSRLLVALRNPELDAVADAVDGRPREHEIDPRRVRLKLGEAVLPGRGVAFVFQVAERGQALEEK
ncbi:hypothetical protein B0H17DRAFT_1193937 [Mycena rosella]|uniref:Uncharacterized protein n=1 Tax=Mycena rosella TaxID=1033263 RepID=A0AAD7GS08_MYCRO|nr:hypothetical protein B0H17DRAFT_1193937 [Mycena rosella]